MLLRKRKRLAGVALRLARRTCAPGRPAGNYQKWPRLSRVAWHDSILNCFALFGVELRQVRIERFLPLEKWAKSNDKLTRTVQDMRALQ